MYEDFEFLDQPSYVCSLDEKYGDLDGRTSSKFIRRDVQPSRGKTSLWGRMIPPPWRAAHPLEACYPFGVLLYPFGCSEIDRNIVLLGVAELPCVWPGLDTILYLAGPLFSHIRKLDFNV